MCGRKRPKIKEYFEIHIGRRNIMVYYDEKGYLRDRRRNKLVDDRKLFPNSKKPFTLPEIKEIILRRTSGVKWDDIGVSLGRCPSSLIPAYSRWKKEGYVDLYRRKSTKLE